MKIKSFTLDALYKEKIKRRNMYLCMYFILILGRIKYKRPINAFKITP